MADANKLLSLFSLVLIYISEVVESTSFFTAEDCLKVGFSSSLQCSSCNELDKFNLLPLKNDCQQCCQGQNENQDSNQSKRTKCVIWAFVKSDRPRQFPGLKIKYVRGADPIIKLMDENYQVKETLGIEKWDTDAVEAFFHERLQK